MYENVAPRLKDYAHWVNWRPELRDTKKAKVPYNSRTGQLARVNDPETWSTFDEACAAAHMYAEGGIGFVLSEIPDHEDPFCFIDFDATQVPEYVQAQAEYQKLFNHTYQERSPSGNGLHIVGIGYVEAGAKSKSCEIYSSLRYMTVTGHKFNGSGSDAIFCQPQIEQFYEWIKPRNIPGRFEIDGPRVKSDQQLWQEVLGSSNPEHSDKVRALIYGGWEQYYFNGNGPDQSAADLALCNILAYYTDCREQVRDLFMASPLGQRKKAKTRPAYVHGLIVKSFDRKVPQMTAEQINKWKRTPPPVSLPVEIKKEKQNDLLSKLPNGLISDIASYIYTAAPTPMAEASVVAAIGLMAGICGRAFNINSAGLNLYLTLIAPPGSGKEAMAKGISSIFNACNTVPGFNQAFEFEGPGRIASGQGLYKAMEVSNHRSLVAVVSEFGDRLMRMRADSKRGDALRMALLDLYSKSGYGQTVGREIFSDIDKTNEKIHSPALSIIGESTSVLFRQGIDEHSISNGLISRLIVTEYTGDAGIVQRFQASPAPNSDLVRRIVDVMQHCIELLSRDQVAPIPTTDEFWAAYVKVQEEANANAKADIRYAEVWTRVAFNSLKLAALFAVARNHHHPMPTVSDLHWAYAFCKQSVKTIVRFVKLGVGDAAASIDRDMELSILEGLIKYVTTDKSLTYDDKKLRDVNIVSKRLLIRGVNARIRQTRRFDIDDAIEALQDSGIIAELTMVDKQELKDNDITKRISPKRKLYAVLDLNKARVRIGELS